MKYKVTNTTVKPVKSHPKTGADLRTAVERVGHGVTIRTETKEHIIVQVNRARIFENITEGMIRLQRGKFIRIEEIEDVSTVLRGHTLDSKKDVFAPDENVKEVLHSAAEGRMARAAQMGMDSHENRGGSESEEAVNPDGEPNFLVRADKNVKRKHRVEKTPSSDESSVEV